MAPTTPIAPHPPELKMSAVVRGSLILIITAANLLALYSAFLAEWHAGQSSSGPACLHMLTVLKNIGVQSCNLTPSLPYLTMFCSCGMMSVPVCCMAGVAGAGEATGAYTGGPAPAWWLASGARLEMDGVVPVVSRLWGVEPSMFWGVCPVESMFGVCPVDSMLGVCPVDSMF